MERELFLFLHHLHLSPSLSLSIYLLFLMRSSLSPSVFTLQSSLLKHLLLYSIMDLVASFGPHHRLVLILSLQCLRLPYKFTFWVSWNSRDSLWTTEHTLLYSSSLISLTLFPFTLLCLLLYMMIMIVCGECR